MPDVISDSQLEIMEIAAAPEVQALIDAIRMERDIRDAALEDAAQCCPECDGAIVRIRQLLGISDRELTQKAKDLAVVFEDMGIKACTGATAAWCPVHGACQGCDREAGRMDAADCPLHGRDSQHAPALCPNCQGPLGAGTGCSVPEDGGSWCRLWNRSAEEKGPR